MIMVDAGQMETPLREEKVIREKTMNILAASVTQIFERLK
jgi:hypothetical protein